MQFRRTGSLSRPSALSRTTASRTKAIGSDKTDDLVSLSDDEGSNALSRDEAEALLKALGLYNWSAEELDENLELERARHQFGTESDGYLGLM